MIGSMRLLIGDTNAAAPYFQDEELQQIANIVAGMESGWSTVAGSAIPQTELVLLSSAQAIDCLATKLAAGPAGQTITLNDYKLTGKDQIQK